MEKVRKARKCEERRGNDKKEEDYKNHKKSLKIMETAQSSNNYNY